MQVVIQCAGSKSPAAGYFRTSSGRRVEFVAEPDAVPPIAESIYAHPDDPSDQWNTSWRNRLDTYNLEQPSNPFGLFEAYRLYKPPIYRELVARFGVGNVFILSAGWGLVNAAYRLPRYDITFSHSQGVEPHKQRKSRDSYQDFCHLNAARRDQIVFFGGKDYLPLFKELTDSIAVEKVIFYRSTRAPSHPTWRPVPYETLRRTNWHYECAGTYLSGRVTI